MKYCLRNRQIGEYLAKADEIKMEYRDYKSIPDLFEKYPEKPIIVQISYQEEEIDWNELELYKRMAPERLICCISTLEQAEICKDLDIKFYCGFPISTFYELRRWLKMGVCYVRLDAPLFFDLPTVAQVIGETPIRAVANVAYESLWSEDDGIHGTWIRPEDVETYEPYISVIEFEDCDNRKEQALYRIYAEQHEWSGEVSMIISNIQTNAVNRMIPPNFAERRIKCKQRCEANGACHLCYLHLKLANPTMLREYKEKVLDAKDPT